MIFEWIALYNNGTHLEQYSGDTENSFGLIDTNILSHFMLKEVGSDHVILVDMETGNFRIGDATENGLINELTITPPYYCTPKRPIWFCRRQVIALDNMDFAEPEDFAWGIGWQTTLDGHNYQYIALAHANDGHITWEANNQAVTLTII
jgi:hypothetical protein